MSSLVVNGLINKTSKELRPKFLSECNNGVYVTPGTNVYWIVHEFIVFCVKHAGVNICAVSIYLRHINGAINPELSNKEVICSDREITISFRNNY